MCFLLLLGLANKNKKRWSFLDVSPERELTSETNDEVPYCPLPDPPFLVQVLILPRRTRTFDSSLGLHKLIHYSLREDQQCPWLLY